MVNVTESGHMLDFTFSDFGVPIINQTVADIILSSDIQKIPIKVNSIPEDFYLMMIKHEIDCVDLNKSIFDIFEKGNKIRPDLEGKFKIIKKLIVDPNRIGDCEIFRIKDYNVTVIVNEKLKTKLERNKVTGIRYIEV